MEGGFSGPCRGTFAGLQERWTLLVSLDLRRRKEQLPSVREQPWGSKYRINILQSSVLAWRIPGTGEPGGLPSLGSQRVGHDWSDLAAAAAAAAFFGIAFFGIEMKTDLFQSCGHCWVFQIYWHIDCSRFTASSFRIWKSSTGIQHIH